MFTITVVKHLHSTLLAVVFKHAGIYQAKDTITIIENHNEHVYSTKDIAQIIMVKES